jgi:uncharacterized protein DUF6496
MHSLINKTNIMAKYSRTAGDKVEKTMKEMNEGTLKSGRSGKTVKDRKQAIAIGLSEARKEGAKVPRKSPGGSSSSGGRSKKSASKKSAPRKSASKKKSAGRSASRASAPRKSSSRKSSSRSKASS